MKVDAFPITRHVAVNIAEAQIHLSPSIAAGVLSEFGPVSRKLEHRLARWLPSQLQVVTCASCTAGLAATLCALDVQGPVAIPGYAFRAVIAAVRAAGLQWIIVDVDPCTALISSEAIRQAAREHGVGAVIALRPHGSWINLQETYDVCSEIGAHLIVDNAAGWGVPECIVRECTIPGAVEVFSMNASKTFGAGEGGFIIAPAELADRVRSALHFGFGSEMYSSRPCNGVSGRLSEYSAAIALCVETQLSSYHQRRLAAAEIYLESMRDLPDWQPAIINIENSALPYFPLIGSVRTDISQTIKSCFDMGLQLRSLRHYDLGGSATPVASSLADKSLCLPLYGDIDVEEARIIISRFVLSQTRIKG